jgi:AraC-like DNA-binding protein
MTLSFDKRPSDSPFVNMIWRAESDMSGCFSSSAVSHWEMVVTRQEEDIFLTVRGPRTRSTSTTIPEHTTLLGIQFELGTFMPHLPPSCLVDDALTLPTVSDNLFWLKDSAWQFPDYDNADTFADRLACEGLLVFDRTIEKALQNKPVHLSTRSVQRAFAHATGLTQRKIAQIQRARHAMTLLQRGMSILDTVVCAGYADQPHLTRSLKQLMGHTPAQLSPSCQQA